MQKSRPECGITSSLSHTESRDLGTTFKLKNLSLAEAKLRFFFMLDSVDRFLPSSVCVLTLSFKSLQSFSLEGEGPAALCTQIALIPIPKPVLQTLRYPSFDNRCCELIQGPVRRCGGSGDLPQADNRAGVQAPGCSSPTLVLCRGDKAPGEFKVRP